MKPLRASFRFPAVGIAVLIFAAAISFSVSISAAEKPSAETTAFAAPSTGDGSLFTAFVSVLRHPRCMNCHSRGDFPARAMMAIPRDERAARPEATA